MTNDLDKIPVVSASLHHILFPLLDEVAGNDETLSKQLKAAFTKVESVGEGFAHDFVHGVIPHNANMIHQTEALLRLAARPCEEYNITHNHPDFTRLQERAVALKRILCKIPDEITTDRHSFLDRVKEIAIAIKEMLDSISEVFRLYSRDTRKQLDFHKRDFVKHSKSFSDTLKLYFRDGKRHSVFRCAERLVMQTDIILVLLKQTVPDKIGHHMM